MGAAATIQRKGLGSPGDVAHSGVTRGKAAAGDSEGKGREVTAGAGLLPWLTLAVPSVCPLASGSFRARPHVDSSWGSLSLGPHWHGGGARLTHGPPGAFRVLPAVALVPLQPVAAAAIS